MNCCWTADPALAQSQVWVGGFQDLNSANEPDEGWRWVNSEGPIPVPGSTVTLGYSNWSPAPNLEPNDTGGNEEHLTLGRYSDASVSGMTKARRRVRSAASLSSTTLLAT